MDRSVSPWKLVYLAYEAEDPNADSVIVPQSTHVLGTSFIQYMTFQGLSFEHDNYVVPAAGEPGNETFRPITPALSIQNSNFMSFDSITVARTSGMGLWFVACLLTPGPPIVPAAGNPHWCPTLPAGGFGLNPVVADNSVLNSSFYDLGASAIGVGFQQRVCDVVLNVGCDTDANVPQRITIQNNVIAGYGRVLPNAFGIYQGIAHDITYTRNDIYDGYRAGIHICPCNQAFKGPSSSGAFNNVISYNHVYNLMQGIMNDSGAVRILSGGLTFQATDNQILNNKIHDINDASILDADGYGGDGIYIDDVTSNIVVKNNLVYRVSRAGLNITMNAHAPGFASTIQNNVFAYARLAMIQNNRPYPTGLSPASPIQVFSATNNIFYFDRNSASTSPRNGATVSAPFYVQGGCTYSGGHAFDSFQNRANNTYWRTDGSFAADASAFRHQPTAGPPGINTICNIGGIHTYLTFAGWQAFTGPVAGPGQDLGSVVQNPGFTNPTYPADDYSIPSPPANFDAVAYAPTLTAGGRVRCSHRPRFRRRFQQRRIIRRLTSELQSQRADAPRCLLLRPMAADDAVDRGRVFRLERPVVGQRRDRVAAADAADQKSRGREDDDHIGAGLERGSRRAYIQKVAGLEARRHRGVRHQHGEGALVGGKERRARRFQHGAAEIAGANIDAGGANRDHGNIGVGLGLRRRGVTRLDRLDHRSIGEVVAGKRALEHRNRLGEFGDGRRFEGGEGAFLQTIERDDHQRQQRALTQGVAHRLMHESVHGRRRQAGRTGQRAGAQSGHAHHRADQASRLVLLG